MLYTSTLRSIKTIHNNRKLNVFLAFPQKFRPKYHQNGFIFNVNRNNTRYFILE